MVLDRLAEYGFVINEDKWQLFQEEVLFLGYRVSGEGIFIDAKKILDVVNVNTTATIEDLRKFLGVTGYLRTFLKNYGIHAAPLYDSFGARSVMKDLTKLKNSFEVPAC